MPSPMSKLIGAVGRSASTIGSLPWPSAASDLHEQTDRPEVQLRHEIRADRQAQRPGRRDMVTGQVEDRLRHADRDVARRVGAAEERVGRPQGEGAARRLGERRGRRGEVGRRPLRHAQARLARRRRRARRRVAIGVQADVDADRDAARRQARVAAGDAVDLDLRRGAGRDRIEEAADVEEAVDAEGLGQDVLDEPIERRRDRS